MSSTGPCAKQREPSIEVSASQTSQRTHRCGALRKEHVGARVRLGGWGHRRRDLGGIVFLDLRDRDGIVQVALGPAWAPPDVLARAGSLGAETVVVVEGEVVLRPANMKNAELATGDGEVHATRLEVVGAATTPAIPVARAKNEELPAEELRLKQRHLDLRRPELQAYLMLRHLLLQPARRTLVEAVLVALWDEAGHAVTRPFPRLRWRDAMERFGTDKPDLRYDLVIADWTAAVAPLAVPFFQTAGQNGARVRGIPVRGGSALSRKAGERLGEAAKQLGGSGLAWVKRQ